MIATLEVPQTHKPGIELYQHMLDTFDYSQITWTMRRYHAEMTEEHAQGMLHAFLQWVALVPSIPDDKWYAMLQTPVEEAFHSFVLNTKHYQRFCQRYLGFFFHHEPVRNESQQQQRNGAEFTINLLEETYGDELHPLLKDWRRQFDAREEVVACVGQGGHCND